MKLTYRKVGKYSTRSGEKEQYAYHVQIPPDAVQKLGWLTVSDLDFLIEKDRMTLFPGESKSKLGRKELTPEEKNTMLSRQHGKCAICDTPLSPKKAVVDHDHKTGYVRGLLCGKCNSGIGLLKDSFTVVFSAASYLQQPVA